MRKRTPVSQALAALLATIFLAAAGYAQSAINTAPTPQSNSQGTDTPTVKLIPDNVAFAVAEYSQPHPDGMRQVLKDLGADDASVPTDFDQLSPLQQLQWAYGALQTQQPGNGPVLLASVIDNVSRTFPAIKSEPRIAAFLTSHSAVPRKRGAGTLLTAIVAFGCSAA